jgi:hypothetical protein
MKTTLLIELLTEELPPKSLAKLGLSFREQMQKAAGDGRLHRRRQRRTLVRHAAPSGNAIRRLSGEPAGSRN